MFRVSIFVSNEEPKVTERWHRTLVATEKVRILNARSTKLSCYQRLKFHDLIPSLKVVEFFVRSAN
jgi:hypothetical protein